VNSVSSVVLVTGAGVDAIAVFDDVRSSAGSGTFGGLFGFQIWHRRTLPKHFRRVVAHCRNSAVLASLLVSVPWVNSTGPLITCSGRIAATMPPSLHPLHVTPQLCRVRRQLLRRRSERSFPQPAGTVRADAEVQTRDGCEGGGGMKLDGV